VKKIILASVLLISSAAFATLTNYDGRGTAQQFCTFSEASFCIDNVKSQADEQARQQGEQQCQMNRGNVVNAGFCSDQCIPNYISPGTANTWVSCTSSCEIECDVPPGNLNTDSTAQ